MIYLIDPKETTPSECQTFCFLKCPLYDMPKPLYGIPPD